MDAVLERSATDCVIRAVTAALEAYRKDIDADEFLSAVRLEVRVYSAFDEPRRGMDRGDVRSVVVQHQSEMKPP